MPAIGIIAGSGFYDVEGFSLKSAEKIATPFGETSDLYSIFELEGTEFVFLPRHGAPHRLAPHRVNYRANLWGFHKLGVRRLFSVNAVGGINSSLKPGDILLPDQIIDLTHGRAATFYEGDEVVHIDFTDPYCPALREVLFSASGETGVEVVETGTYLCVNGPRLETRAEIRLFARLDADVVGMTAMPEAALARELEICFACLAVVTNYAAGISKERLTTVEVKDTMRHSMDSIRALLAAALPRIPEMTACGCGQALHDSKM